MQGSHWAFFKATDSHIRARFAGSNIEFLTFRAPAETGERLQSAEQLGPKNGPAPEKNEIRVQNGGPLAAPVLGAIICF